MDLVSVERNGLWREAPNKSARWSKEKMQAPIPPEGACMTTRGYASGNQW